MTQLLSSNWLKRTIYFTAAAVFFTFIPFSPIAIVGGLILITILPGAQLLRWLGLYQQKWDFATVVLSVTLGIVTSPLLIYWSSLLFGFSRGLLLIVFPLYIILLAAYVARNDTTTPVPDEQISSVNPIDSSPRTWLIVALLIGFTALGVFLAYFELETEHGFYPVQMEDWQKHYGVAFALRHTGIPPTSMFFYGMFPDDSLIYYYFLHLNGAALDLLQGGASLLHYTFVIFIMLASVGFSSVFFLLARTLFGSQKTAVWSLAFITIIGGLDVIPILHHTIQQYRANFPDGPLPLGVFLPREHIDNWISALSLRINTFFAYHIWVPQHLTGLTILCLGCYLYLKVKDRRKLLVIIPILLFALLGHSTWIAALVAGCLFLFALIQIYNAYRQQGFIAARTVFLGYAIIAIAFMVLASPFILSLVGPHAPKSGIAFEIPTLDGWAILRPFQATYGPAIWARLLDLPLHFLVEMGALLVAGVAGLFLFWRDIPTSNSRPDYTPTPYFLLLTSYSLLPLWILFLIIGTLIVTFFASGRGWQELGLILNNDLGLRAMMPAQLVLALFAGYFITRLPTLRLSRLWKGAQIGALTLLIGLGIAYAGWEFTSMGLAKYWTNPQLSPDIYKTLRALPEVTQAQDKPLPVVQHRLHRNASRFQLSLGGRPIGFSTGEAVVFHQDVQALALALELSRQGFDNGLPVRSYQLFKNLGADYIFVGPAEREAIRHPEKYQHPQYFQPVFRQGDYEIYEVEPLPYNQEQIQARFDEGIIEFAGYFIDSSPIYPADQSVATISEKAEVGKGLVTAWRLTRPTTKDYTVFIHFVGPEGNIVAQADHQLWAWDVKSEGPTTTWTPELTHLDLIPIPQTVLAAESSLSIRLGLWLPDTGEHFPVETHALEVDDGGRLIIGKLSH